MTSKEIVRAALEFNNPPRVPRQMWTLPWSKQQYPTELAALQSEFPDDIISCPAFLRQQSPVAQGDPYAVGDSVDEWGCRFSNLHAGIIGEVKQPIVLDEDWQDVSNVYLPKEHLELDTEAINRFCQQNSDKFILPGCCPRPFERLQFIRGTEQLYIDLMLLPDGLADFMQTMHRHYCDELTAWAQTDVDGLTFMDDWGAQHALLINPKLWEQLFKPMYKDYIEIAHQHGKKAFMHSDGYILDIYPHLVELGLDAINSQLFCMGIQNLKPYAGKITFWGEMDRQHLLPSGRPQDIRQAVREIHNQLYHNGGCIAQCEFGPGAKPENIHALYDEWNKIKE